MQWGGYAQAVWHPTTPPGSPPTPPPPLVPATKAPPPSAAAYALGLSHGVAQTLAAAAEAEADLVAKAAAAAKAEAEADLVAKAAEAAKAEADDKAKAVPLITAKRMPRPKPTIKAFPYGTPVVQPGQPGQVPPDIICPDE